MIVRLLQLLAGTQSTHSQKKSLQFVGSTDPHPLTLSPCLRSGTPCVLLENLLFLPYPKAPWLDKSFEKKMQ